MNSEVIVALLIVPIVFVVVFLSVGIVETLDRRAQRRERKP